MTVIEQGFEAIGTCRLVPPLRFEFLNPLLVVGLFFQRWESWTSAVVSVPAAAFKWVASDLRWSSCADDCSPLGRGTARCAGRGSAALPRPRMRLVTTALAARELFLTGSSFLILGLDSDLALWVHLCSCGCSVEQRKLYRSTKCQFAFQKAWPD